MKKLLTAAVTLILILFGLSPQDVQAQRIDLAPSVGYGFRVFNQVGDPGTISIGGQSHIYLREGDKRMGQDGRRQRVSLILNPGLDYYMFDINGMSGFQLDVNALLGLGRRTSLVSPYGGLGLGLSIVTGDEELSVEGFCPDGRPAPCILSDVESGTNIGLNILGGVLWGSGSPRIMTQLRYTIGSHELHRNPDDASAGSGLAFQGGIIFRLND